MTLLEGHCTTSNHVFCVLVFNLGTCSHTHAGNYDVHILAQSSEPECRVLALPQLMCCVVNSLIAGSPSHTSHKAHSR